MDWHRNLVPECHVVQQGYSVEEGHLDKVRLQGYLALPELGYEEPMPCSRGQELGQAMDRNGDKLSEGDERSCVGMRAGELL